VAKKWETIEGKGGLSSYFPKGIVGGGIRKGVLGGTIERKPSDKFYTVREVKRWDLPGFTAA